MSDKTKAMILDILLYPLGATIALFFLAVYQKYYG